MSRILDFSADDRVTEYDISTQAEMSDKVTVYDVMRHLELIAQVPNGTGDALAARGALNLIQELAAYANLDLTMLSIDVKATSDVPWVLSWGS